jgi:hypothetical protein
MKPHQWSKLDYRAHADSVLVAAREERPARRGAHCRHMEAVIGQTHLPDAREGRRPDWAAEGFGTTEASVVD